MSDSESTLEDTVETFLRRNVPQIQMHGGSATIETDEETGTVSITLGGACTGCGLQPMTMDAIRRKLIEEIPEVADVQIGSAENPPSTTSLSLSSDDDDDTNVSDAPF